MELTPEQVRVLGCLVEKESTTPDLYPLSTNALVAACNQRSSRDPVVGEPVAPQYVKRESGATVLDWTPAQP